MEQLREPRFYPNEQDLDVLAKTKSTIKITVDSEGLDEAIEKTNRLVGLLKEAQQIVGSLLSLSLIHI